jgi:hypothetical protein
MWHYFSSTEFQKRVIYLLMDIRDAVSNQGAAGTVPSLNLSPQVQTVDELQRLDDSLKSLETREKMVRFHP